MGTLIAVSASMVPDNLYSILYRPAEVKSGLGEASSSADVGTVGESNCSIPIRKEDDLEAACCSNQEDESIVEEDIGASIPFLAFIITGTVSSGVGSGVCFAVAS